MLAVGVLIVPAIFSWFMLRKGHSVVSRVVAIGWMVLVLSLVLTPHGRESALSVLSGGTPISSREFVTLEKFNRLRTGMTYETVVKILGREGDVLSDVGGPGPAIRIYQWTNGLSNMNATFQDGRLMAKAQLGLR